MSRHAHLLLLAAFVLNACTFISPAAPHKPVRFSETASPPGDERFPHWTLPPIESFEELQSLRAGPYEVKTGTVRSTSGGTSGAYQAVVKFPKIEKEVKFKGKQVPPDLDGINNAPRKELAAYHVQSLFLDPDDYVVPTTFLACVPIERWNRDHGTNAKPNLEGANCMLTVLALWLEDVTLPEALYDEERFLSDPQYAHFLSNLNVFTVVIDHRDGRHGNFLIAKDDRRRQVFAVDNGSTFDPLAYNYFVANWNVVRVASVRRETIDRLRKLERSDLDPLAVVAQVEIRDDGSVQHVAPGAPLDADVGAVRRGNTVQLGLTRDEIDGMWKRIQKLIGQVDAGELPVF